MNNQLLRRLIWLYLFLWLIEGALRFWILKPLANPLLYVRDPVALLIYVVALQTRRLPVNGYVVGMVLLGIGTALMTLLFGHGRFDVMLIGLRSNFLHLPLIFVFGSVLTSSDLARVGRWTVTLSVPMAVLVVQQFRSSPDSPINAGGMLTHYSTVRPAGTFSFAAGLACYMTLLAAYLVMGMLKPSGLRWWQVVAGVVALLAMVAVSGSRTAVASVAIVVLLGLVCSIHLKGGGGGIIGFVILCLMGFAFVSSTEFGEEGAEQLQQRFTDASRGQSSLIGGLAQRLHSVTFGTLEWASRGSVIGYGIGAGTSAGGFLLTGQRSMLGGEAEWGRVMYEMGSLMGLIFILMRGSLAISLLRRSLLASRRADPAPLILFGCAWLHLTTGQWGIPTLQGFAAIAGGLCLAAHRNGMLKRNAKSRPALRPQLVVETPASMPA